MVDETPEISPARSGARSADAATGKRRDIVLLAAGACLGIGAAVYGLLVDDAARPLPPDAAARVNERIIDNADLADALAALGNDSRDRLDGGDREWILRRLIEEELLVQRALELDLGHADREARAALVDAMIRRVTRDAAARRPGEQELRDWYAANRHLFTDMARLRIEAWRAPDAAHAERLAAALADGSAPPPSASRLDALPDALLPPAKLRDYLGPGPLQALVTSPIGEWTGPFLYAGDTVIARVTERRGGEAPPLETIRERVELAWRRALMDAALASYLSELRDRAAVETAGP